jgi:hypothetical protein
MNRTREIEQIEETLGRMFTTQELGPYSAFCSPIDAPINETSGRLEGNVEIEDVLATIHKVTQQLEEYCLRWSAMGYTVFVGYPNDFGPHTVFAIANADPIQLMDIFDVGNYNDMTGDTPDRAKRYMAKLFKTDPFVPYHVDAANFKVQFVNPVSAARAGEIAEAIVEFNPDAYALVNLPRFDDDDDFADEPAGPEYQRHDESPVDVMQRLIMHTRKLELWWD